ncbi:MAG: SAM-dependent chlorinase/fluorinase, partial [Gammaproteobacteria bacterium]|nr:SAM-dependent chlorinase/fluorinase [Gammaproteobacteria bacterium]
HGRDLFAPVAAMLANRSNVDSRRSVLQHAASELWPEDLAQVVYVDHFGNAMIGTRATWLSHDSCVLVHGQSVGYARTFSEVPCGSGLWYENANGLVEVAINQGSAASDMGIQIGDKVEFVAT